MVSTTDMGATPNVDVDFNTAELLETTKNPGRLRIHFMIGVIVSLVCLTGTHYFESKLLTFI
jgi:hypothetical protein